MASRRSAATTPVPESKTAAATTRPVTSERWLNSEQVLEILPITMDTLNRWVSKGVIPAYHIEGSRLRFFRIEDVSGGLFTLTNEP